MILYHKRAAFFPKGKEISPASKTSRFAPGKQLLNEKYRTIVLGMKLVGFFMLIACLHAGAKGFSQTVTLAGKDLPLRQVFDRIEDQTGYGIFIDKATLAESKPVTINFKDATIELVMKACLKEQPFPLTFTITGHTVNVIKAKVDDGHRPATDAIPTGTPPTILQEFKGHVTNEAGEPLQGASVEVKNMRTGTFTDVHGIFILKNISSDAVLELSFTGYQKTTIKLAGSASQEFVLRVATNKLDQIQVIAYGTTTERLNTGDVTTINAKDIEQQPVSDPILALEGRVAGLFVTQTSGFAGSGVTARIMGQNSLFYGNDPLFIVDGVPYTSQLLPTFNGIQTGGGDVSSPSPFSFINPSDIESISVLKDADATSIYGSRAANGAILITTKKGKSGRTKVDFNLQSGFGRDTRRLKLLNTQQYLEMRHEAINNDGLTSGPTDYDVNGTWDTTHYTDWQKTLLGKSSQYTTLTGTVSGGDSNTQYLVGTTFHRETTVFPGDFADQKGSLHANINSASSNKLFKFQLTASYLFDDNRLPSHDLTYDAICLSPNAPSLYNSGGGLNWQPQNGNSSWNNPLAYQYLQSAIKTRNLITNSIISYQILPGLTIKSSFGYTDLETNETQIVPSTSQPPEDRPTWPGYSNFGNSYINSWIIEPTASYKWALGKGKWESIVGETIEQNNSYGQQIEGSGYSSDLLLGNIQSATTIYANTTASTIYKYNAAFGRLNYNWDDKYLVNLTARRDGSSRFGPSAQFHDFGSIAGSWIFSKENLFQTTLPSLSFGKLGISYGTTGNDQIGDYQFLSLYNSTNVPIPYQGSSGLQPSGLSNPYLEWEETKKLRFGLDLGFLKDRILLTSNYFVNRSSNQLLGYTLPIITGFNTISKNFPATVQNYGWEITLNSINIKTRDFSWSTHINLTIPENKLVAFPNLPSSPYATNYIIGKPITILQVFHLLGVNDTTGEYEFGSQKTGPTYNPVYGVDNTVIVNTAPRLYGGFQNTFDYKGFELSIFFQFVKQVAQNYVFGSFPGEFNGSQNYGNQPLTVLDRWEKPGDVASIQRFNSDGSLGQQSGDAQRQSDASFSDASYVRLKNLSFSWQMPEKWRKGIRSQNARLFVQGQNLLTITKFKGLDPESPGPYVLPPLRVITVGVQLTL
jgi:TonB-linked SusC/RagA family outer membrane protein